MKKQLLLLAILCSLTGAAQVTQIWTDFNSFWTSNSTNINTVKPNTAHNLLAFRWNGVNYSTAVNNAKLTANGVVFSPTKFRALPINDVPLTSSSAAYFVGLGALVDGLPTAVDNGNINPFKPLLTGAQKAAFLTKGVQGLDLGSCLTNIPTGTAPNLTSIRFNLSSSGITLSNVNDGIPDILISQVAQPSANNSDKFRFVNAAGNIVGNEVVVLLNDNVLFPTVGNWTADFYNNDSTQSQTTFVNTDRPLRFFAADLTLFGITSSNYMNAVALIYTPGGDSDPAFLAFNEPSLGVATKLVVTSQPVTSVCNGTMASNFTIQLQDRLGLPVLQPGIEITASMETGPGNLLGTLTATTNASGIATFSNLSFEVGGDHQIRFSNSSLDVAISANIVGAAGCDTNIWTGNGTNNNWNNTANWQTATIPNANNNVEIPAGRPRYPVLQNNAGAKNIILGDNATINLNGRVFAISGTITANPTAKIIASVDESVLYMSGSTPQSIPNGLILNGNIANLTIENVAGVTNTDFLKIAQVLLVRSGTFATGNTVNLVCRFTPTRRTAQIGPIGVSGFITGDVTVEQCFPARRAFRFLTSSVTTTTSIRANWQENATAWNANPNPGYGTHITGVGASGSNPSLTDGTNGFDWQPSGASSLFSFNNSSQIWSSVNNTQGNLVAGVPYRMLLRGNRSTDIQINAAAPTNTILRSTGTILKGPVAVNGLSATSDHFNLVGNPFQAVVDMALVNGNSTNLKPFYYVWDPTLGGAPTVGQPGGRGAYVAVNTITGVKSNPLSAVTNYLQPYQAFFVQTSNLGTTPQITFREEYKAISNTQTNVFKLMDNDDEQGNQFIELTLFNQQAFTSDDTPSDGLRIDFSNTSNSGVDDFDAVKFPNSDENISRMVGTSLVSMENRALPQAGEFLPLNVTQYRKDAYTMKINVSDFTGFDVYLKDYFTNQEILLENGGTTNYSFTVNTANAASTNADRFAFFFLQAQLNTNQPTAETAFTLYPNPVKGSLLFLNANTSFDNAQIEIYNLVGQKVMSFKADFGGNNQITIPVSELNTGMYLINAKTNTGLNFSSKFIKN
jgi:hypothetical protein